MDRCNRTAQYINGKDQIEKLNEYLSYQQRLRIEMKTMLKFFMTRCGVMVKMMWYCGTVFDFILVKVFKNSLKVSCLKYFGIHVYLGYQYPYLSLTALLISDY